MFSDKLFDGGLFGGGLFKTLPIFGDTAPPPQPTPWDRQLPDPDGMDGYETTFPTAVVGGVVIGIAGKNNANLVLGFTVLVNDEPVEVLAYSGSDRLSTSFSYIACVPDLPIGTHTLKIVMDSGCSAGTAALRIIETDPMPVGWQGAGRGNFGLGTSNGVSASLSGTQSGSTVLSIAAWADSRAYPPTGDIRISSGVYEPQQTIRTDLIRNLVSCGFFRAPTTGTSISLNFSAANPSHSWSIAMAEFRGVTFR